MIARTKINLEIDPSLLNLNSLSFCLVLIILTRTLPLFWLPRLGAFSCKVARTPTIKATICVARTTRLFVT
jgi:hypothetical protein